MSKQIIETALYKKLLAIEGTPAPLSAIISEHLQKVAELLLGEIGAFMPDYTLHNLTHVVNVLDIINNLLPSEVVLNRSELTILIYAVTLHDIGMLVNREEIPRLKADEAYRRILAEFDKDTPDDEILAELIRRTHVKRSCEYVDRFKSNPSTYHLDFEIDGIDFRKHLKHINLKSKTLSVKASRESIIKDSAFGLLQNMISDLVLDNYKDTPAALIRYIGDGSHNIITNRQREYDFLSNHIEFIVVDTKRNVILQNYPLFAKLRQKKCLCKIGFISLNLYRYNAEMYGKEILSSCDYIVLASSNMHYFVQLAKPYCVTASEVISAIPGLIYHLISYDFTRTVELKDYSNNYSYEEIDKDVQLISSKPIFCHITNNQYNFLRLTYNRRHPWGKLFTEQSEILCVKKASIVLKENIETAMFDASSRPLKNLIEYPGEYYRFHSNTWDHSEKTIGIFESEIVNSINDYLYRTIDSSLLSEYGLIDKPLTIDDFIPWWFAKE